MSAGLLRFNGAIEHHPAIDAWLQERSSDLGPIAQQWFEKMRKCGDEVRELMHDGCPVACLGDVPFAYVNVFTSHVNVGFFQGASLPDPARLLRARLRDARSAEPALPQRLIHLTIEIRPLQNLPRLRAICRPHQPVFLHQVDQVRRPPVPYAQPPLQQRRARLSELEHQPHRIVEHRIVLFALVR